MRVRRTVVGLGLATVILAGAAATSVAQERSLYDRLGKYDGIAAVTDEFLARALADPKVARFFVGLSTDSKNRFRQQVVEQFCMLAGGPCVYTGRSMKMSHAGLAIAEADWDLSLKYVVEALDKYRVPEKEKSEFLGALTKLKPDIVEK
jgi:hemoglobin